MKKILCLIFTIFLLAFPVFGENLVNFTHLNELKFTFEKGGKKYTAWAIYSKPERDGVVDGKYIPVPAPKEGYACTDDVARIALLYLSRYEKTKRDEYLQRSKEALEFLLYMENGKGLFYNFIDKKGNISKKGDTSKASLDWWTARAFWAIGRGIRVIKNKDPQFANKLHLSFKRTLKEIRKYRQNLQESPLYPSTVSKKELINQSGAITSIFVLGMLEYDLAYPQDSPKDLITAYSNALSHLQEKSLYNFPFYGVHYSTASCKYVHIYGNRQVMALSLAGMQFNRKDWIKSAESEANVWYPFLLSFEGVLFGMDPYPLKYPQISYSTETIVSNLKALYTATGKRKYMVLAGILAGWFFKNNPVKEEVYIAYKGLCLDGIDKVGINTNSGAESTVEALLTMDAIEGTVAQKYIDLKPIYRSSLTIVNGTSLLPQRGDVRWVLRHTIAGKRRKVLFLDEPTVLKGKVYIPKGDYRIYLIYRCRQKLDITLRLKNRKRNVTLPATNNFYNCTFIESVTIRNNGKTSFYVKYDRESPLYIDSVIFLPHFVQVKWKAPSKVVVMLLNTFPYKGSAVVDLSPVTEKERSNLTCSTNLMQIIIPPWGWLILSDEI